MPVFPIFFEGYRPAGEDERRRPAQNRTFRQGERVNDETRRSPSRPGGDAIPFFFWVSLLRFYPEQRVRLSYRLSHLVFIVVTRLTASRTRRSQYSAWRNEPCHLPPPLTQRSLLLMTLI